MSSINAPVRTHMTNHAPAWAAWQERLTQVLATCESKWGIEIGEPISRHATSSLFRVRLRGRDAVLKLARPGSHVRQQARILDAAKGEGYVHLYEHDDDLGALLLESLGPSMESRGKELYAGLSTAQVLSALAESPLVAPLTSALKVAWQLPRDIAATPNGSTHKAAELRDLIDRLADAYGVRDRHADAIARARLYAEHRLSARGSSPMVLCHGDPHPGNLLAVSSPRPGAPTGYVWVDPDGFLCEPEYDLGVVLRGFNSLILAADDPVITLRSWCAVLAEATGTDAEAIWQWAYIERVSSGLYLISQGWPERGRRFLESASWVIARKR